MAQAAEYHEILCHTPCLVAALEDTAHGKFPLGGRQDPVDLSHRKFGDSLSCRVLRRVNDLFCGTQHSAELPSWRPRDQ